jgi:uncharacterized protein (TIGR02147 family)
MLLVSPVIYEYKNHRSYIRSIFLFKKKNIPAFSYSYCAKKMKVSSGYLKNVFTGRRDLGLDYVSVFSKTFGLSGDEKRYLTVMIICDQSKDAELRDYFQGVLATLRARALEFRNQSYFNQPNTTEKTLSDVTDHLVLSLVKLKGFKPDEDWIGKRICSPKKLTQKEIERSLENLKKRSLIVLEMGEYRVLDDCLSSPDPYDPDSFKIYRTGLKQIDQALEQISDYKSCNFFMANLTIDENQERKALEIFNRCRDELMALEKQSSNPEKILAISNNLITLAR